MKKAIPILGVNGSGKSTYYKTRLAERFKTEGVTYINADEIKQRLQTNGMESNQAKFKSGHLATSEIIKCIREGKSFAFETTFTDNGPTGSLAILQEAKKAGYDIEGHFVHTTNIELNIDRVEHRFIKGTGHYVPPEIIAERYIKCTENVKNNENIFDTLNYIDNTNFDFKISNSSLLLQDSRVITDDALLVNSDFEKEKEKGVNIQKLEEIIRDIKKDSQELELTKKEEQNKGNIQAIESQPKKESYGDEENHNQKWGINL